MDCQQFTDVTLFSWRIQSQIKIKKVTQWRFVLENNLLKIFQKLTRNNVELLNNTLPSHIFNFKVQSLKYVSYTTFCTFPFTLWKYIHMYTCTVDVIYTPIFLFFGNSLKRKGIHEFLNLLSFEISRWQFSKLFVCCSQFHRKCFM